MEHCQGTPHPSVGTWVRLPKAGVTLGWSKFALAPPLPLMLAMLVYLGPGWNATGVPGYPDYPLAGPRRNFSTGHSPGRASPPLLDWMMQF